MVLLGMVFLGVIVIDLFYKGNFIERWVGGKEF